MLNAATAKLIIVLCFKLCCKVGSYNIVHSITMCNVLVNIVLCTMFIYVVFHSCDLSMCLNKSWQYQNNGVMQACSINEIKKSINEKKKANAN